MLPYLLSASEEEEGLARATPDVKSLQVARVYGEALLNAAEQAGQVDEVLDEYEALLEALRKPRSDLRPFFVSGVIGRRTRADVLRKVFDGRIHPLILNLLLVVNDHDRMPLLAAILYKARDLRDERAGRLPVNVHVAVPLTDEQVEAVRRRIAAGGFEPRVEVQVDPELLGGLQLRIGDWVFDGTVRTWINQLQKEILSRSSYEIQSGRDRFSSAS